MKFYSFQLISERASCIELAQQLYGATVRNGHCNAAWRGGDNPNSVAIEKDKWYDHVASVGGGAVQLAAYKFNGDVQQAQAYLGEFYNLTPHMETGPAPARDCRYERLLRDGYKEVARYEYRNIEGEVAHVTVRLQHPDKPGKEFVQGHPDERGGIVWTLKGVSTVLYNASTISKSSWVALCEGEKSADRLVSLGFPASTSPMGAGKWRDSYSESLRDKDVAIFPDNDEPGREHSQIVAAALHGIARTIKIVGPLATAPKGGVDDWMDESPSNNKAALLAAVSAAPAWAPPTTSSTGPSDAQLAEAKQANSIPFRNYIPEETETIKRNKPVKEIAKKPRTHSAMLDDISRRFLGFPRRVGDNWLFDHDRDGGHIHHINNAEHLMSWIGRRSKHNPDFARGDAFVTQRELLASIEATAHRYEAISTTPDFPQRDDVYYTHGAIPTPDPSYSRFNTLVDFFCPESPQDRMLVAALICAPLWFIPGIDRPSWIIDSRDGQGSGKTNLAEIVADLYGHAPISTSKQELAFKMDVLVKRCVSQSGRKARVLLVDNVTGDFQSPELSDIITRKDITDMAPYGRGEEVRPNNLTIIITANTATVGTDIADRSMYIHLSKPPSSPENVTWKARVQKYIDNHRLEIVADIIAMLSSHKPFDSAPQTRFAAWETAILQPCCGDQKSYNAVIEHIKSAREESNVEQDQARAIIELFEFNIERYTGSEIQRPVFLRSEVVNSWGRSALNDSMGSEFKGRPLQLIKNLAKQGFIPQIDPSIRRWPTSSRAGPRFNGIAWNFENETDAVMMLSRDADGEIAKRIV